MSLTPDELEYLMAYVDGQFDDDETPEAEALLAKNDEARRLVDNVMAVGDWVREASDAKAAKADGIADAVMDEAEALGGAKVILLEREKARRALNRQRVKEFSALAAVAAAVALFYALPNNAGQQPDVIAQVPPEMRAKPAPTEAPVAPPSAAPEEPAFASTDEGVVVDSVESAHQVSIFYLPGVANANASSVVVWIGDDQEAH
jgi:anti-sigma factor RsiW